MYKVVIVGFGSIGFRYFEAINKIKLSNIKLFIIDKKIKFLLKKHNLEKWTINTSNNFKSIPKKIDLCIVSTTCKNRHILLKKLVEKSNLKNLILEKPLTQSPTELLKLNRILKNMKNVWVNTDRRSLDIYKFVGSRLNIKSKIIMKVEGNSWGICCNSLHFIDLFNFLSNQLLSTIDEKSILSWFPSKREGFQELDDGKLKLKFGKHELYLSSRKNSKQKNLKIYIKNEKNFFHIKEKIDIFELKFKEKKSYFKNEPLSVKMKNIIENILLKKKSTLPNYSNSAKLYYPLINFFLKKWKTHNPKATKVPIT
jgi:hypothetical protein